MPEVLFFFRCFDISIFQGKFLSVYTLSDLVNETCFIELLSIVRHRGLLKVSNFRLETINMNSVFDLLRGDLCKSGPGQFASEKSFPSNFAQ